MRDARASILVLVWLTVALTACGSAKKDQGGEVGGRTIVAETPALRDALLTVGDIRRASSGTPMRAFLEHWSELQYASWGDAVRDYSPRLREALGTDNVVEAIKSQAATFRSRKPRLVDTVTDGDRATVRFIGAVAGGGTEAPMSISWGKNTAERWQIVYDPFLDEAIRQQVQAATQTAVDPSATKPSKQAIQAGYNASRLQSQYLKELLERGEEQTGRPGDSDAG